MLIALCAVGLMTFSACESKGDLWLKEASIDAVLSENGDLTVHETWQVKTTDSYRNLYRTLSLTDNKFNKASSFTLLSVYNNTEKKEFPISSAITSMNDSVYESNVNRYKGYSYVVENGSNSYEIGVILTSALEWGENISITFNYLIQDFAGTYADTAEFDWKPYSSDFSMYIEKLNMTIAMPASVDYTDEDNTFAWLHCTAQSNISLDKNVITVTAEKVDAGTSVGVHSLVPTSCFANLKKTSSSQKKSSLIAQEDAWQESYLKEQRKLAIFGIVDIVATIAFIVIAVAVVILSHVFGKYRVKKDDKRYLREIPSDWTAAEMGEFFYWYKGGAKKHSGAILSATMLDLARRDYLNIIPDKNAEYLIEVTAVPQSKKDDLRDFENELMILLSEVQKSNGNKPFSMKSFEKFAKNNITFVNRHMSKFLTASTSKFKAKKCVKPKQPFQSVGALLSALFIFIAVIALVFMQKYFFYIFFGGFISGLALIFGTYKIRPLTDEGNKVHADTLALRDYMLDFSNLKEYDVPQLILWEEYLVYATMMGISEKVVKKLKLVYRELMEPNTYDPTYYRRGYIYTYFFLASRPHHTYGSAKPFDLGRSMQTAVRNANAFVHAQQVASSVKNSSHGSGFGGHGGGGFSGGGGFGGGGGGGRH